MRHAIFRRDGEAAGQRVRVRPFRTKKEAGFVVILAALLLAVLISMAGIATDVGYARYMKRQMQKAADAGAIGGASEVTCTSCNVTTAAQNDTAQNGITNGTNGVTVTVTQGPSLPAGVNYKESSSYCVQVTVSQAVPTFFMRVFNYSSINVGATATACQRSGPNCIYALDPSATNAILVNGSMNLDFACGMVVDSNASQALLNNGSSTITASTIGVVGGYLNNGSGTISPTPVTGIKPASNPLASLSAPTVGACNYNNETINGSGNFTLTPGVYCGGITINGSANVTFTSGDYILTGGTGLTINGTNTVTGNGVMFYNGGTGSITINGGNTVTLTAPTTGTYAGILLFQAASNTSQVTLNGGNSQTLTGALYAPTANLTENGCNPVAAYSIIVADTITFNGSCTFGDNYSSLANGSPIQGVALVE